VIDEVSFMNDSIFKKINWQLMQVGNRTKSFGGFFDHFCRWLLPT
jgi:hypothetical protein